MLALAIRQSLAAAVFGRVSYQGPATVYAALYTGASDPMAGGTEVAGNAYVRLELVNDQVTFTLPDADAKVGNAAQLIWPLSTGAWGGGDPITVCRLYDAASGGNLVGGALLPNPVEITGAMQTVVIAAGALSLTVANPA